MTRPLLLALLLAGCGSYTTIQDHMDSYDSCLIRARAPEAESWCREKAE